jgi:hypothetical protein
MAKYVFFSFFPSCEMILEKRHRGLIEVLSQHLPDGTEKIKKNFNKDNRCRTDIRIIYLTDIVKYQIN